jgi:hypothetical protein
LSLDSNKNDDEITVEVSISNNPGIAVFLIELQFDKSKVIPVSISQGEILSSSQIISNLSPGIDFSSLDKISTYWVNPMNFTKSGLLYIAKFKVKSDATGRVDFSIYYKFGDIANQNFEDIKPSITNTYIELGGDVVPNPTQPQTNPSNNNTGHGRTATNTPMPKPTEQSDSTVLPKTTENPKSIENKFNDLGNYNWAKEAICSLLSEGIVKGVSEIEFAPQNYIKRADYMLLLVRMLELKADVTENFEDVMIDKYYYKEIGISKALGLTKGVGDNKFNPEANITRQDMFVLAYRILQKQGLEIISADHTAISSFSDYDQIGDYSKESIATLVFNKLIEGSDNQINPVGNASRAETALFVYRIKQLLDGLSL